MRNPGRVLVIAEAVVAALGVVVWLLIAGQCENGCGDEGLPTTLLSLGLFVLPGAVLAGLGALVVKRRIDREIRARDTARPN